MMLAKAIKTKKRLTAELMRLVQKREKYFLVDEEAEKYPYDYGILSAEISEKAASINRIQSTINRINISTKVKFENREISLYEAIILFGSLKAELANIEKLIAKIPSSENETERFYSARRKKDDVELIPIVDLDYLTKEQEKLEKRKDALDELIQKTNWSTEIS